MNTTVMMVTKKMLARRTFLRGAGAAIALPFLDAMVPALSAASRTAAKGVPRLGFFYIPNGVYPSNFHPAGEGGTSFALTPILEPLQDLKQKINVITGLGNYPGTDQGDQGGGDHARGVPALLTCAHPRASETIIDVPLASLQKDKFAINGHRSAQDAKTYVFCGDIAAQ